MEQEIAGSLPRRKFFGIETKARFCNKAAAATFFFLLGIGFSCMASRLPDIKNALELSDKAFGTVLLMLPAGQFTAMFLSSWLVGKFGSRNILTAGFVAYPTSLVLVGSVSSLWQLYAALYIFGACGNLCNISVNTQAVGVERIYKRSVMGFFHGMWSLAGFTGGLLSIFLVRMGFSVREHFCLLLFLSAFAIFAMYPYLVAKDLRKPRSDAPKRRLPKPDKFIMLLGFVAFCCMATEGTMFDWSIIYYEDVILAHENEKRYGFIAFMSMMALGRFTSDRLVMKMGSIRVLKISGVFVALGLAIAVAFPHMLVSALGFAMVGLGVSSVVPLCYSLAGKSRTMNTGTAIAGVSSIGFFGFLFGPPVIGYISEYSSLRWSFSLIALVGFMITILAPRIKTPDDADE